MHIRSYSFWCVVCLGLACVVACSDDSGTSPDIDSGADLPGGSSAVIGDDGQPIPGSSVSGGGDTPLSQGGLPIASSSSKKDDGSHEGPLPGEDPQMVPVDTPLTYAGNFPVIFSEVSPENANFKDNDGNDPGWLELYNTSDAPVSLKGVALSNDAKYPRRWVFGNATVPAKSHMVVFLSGKNYADYVAPSDSVNMIGTDCSSESSSGGMNGFNFGDWGGGMNPGAGAGAGATTTNAENLPGKSALCYNEGGANQIGAVVKVSPNKGSYTRVVVNAASKLGNADQLVVRGTSRKTMQ